MALSQFAALLTAGLGCVTDLRSRRLPNVLTFGFAAVALLDAAWFGGWSGAGWAAVSWFVGLALFLPVFLLRGMGGGDVKLLAALGAWLGVASVVRVGLYAAIAGGVLAIGLALARGYGRQLFGNAWSMLSYWRVMGPRPHPVLNLDTASSRERPRLPYAVPIAVGLLVTLWRQ